jgi:hypothetical protein
MVRITAPVRVTPASAWLSYLGAECRVATVIESASGCSSDLRIAQSERILELDDLRNGVEVHAPAPAAWPRR